MKIYPHLLIPAILLAAFYFGCQKTDQKENNKQNVTQENLPSAESLVYTIPEGWIKEQPRSTMRRAQYRLPGQQGSDDAELAVFVFPGTGGSVQANIDRWIGQFTQPDKSPSSEKANIEQIESHGLNITTLYLTGIYVTGSMGGPQQEMQNFAVLGAIVETSGDPWFFKTVGPEITINHWKPSFQTFLSTIQESHK